MNKSLQIALLAVILGIVLSQAAPGADAIKSISPAKSAKGDVSVTLTYKGADALKSTDVVIFSTKETPDPATDPKYTLTADATTTPVTATINFPSDGTYKCYAKNGVGTTEQTGKSIEIAGKYLSVSLLIGALFLLF